MASLNKVMLIGNVGRDAELRYLASGTAKSEFSLAVNRSWRPPGGGEWQEETEWFNIVVWAAQAERVSQNITKGKQVYVEGRLQTRSWDDDQGVKHYRTEVIANTVSVLGGRGSGGGRDGGDGGGDDWGGGSPSTRGRGGYSGPRDGGGDFDADDLPFE